MTDLVLVRGYEARVHLASCPAVLRREKWDVAYHVYAEPLDAQAVVEAYVRHVDEPTHRVCKCARSAFPPDYLRGRKDKLAAAMGVTLEGWEG